MSVIIHCMSLSIVYLQLSVIIHCISSIVYNYQLLLCILSIVSHYPLSAIIHRLSLSSAYHHPLSIITHCLTLPLYISHCMSFPLSLLSIISQHLRSYIHCIVCHHSWNIFIHHLSSIVCHYPLYVHHPLFAINCLLSIIHWLPLSFCHYLLSVMVQYQSKSIVCNYPMSVITQLLSMSSFSLLGLYL